MGKLISDKFKEWKKECEDRFNTLKANEEELNRIFIDIYGLKDELTPTVEPKDVTVRLADEKREIKSLISYAVGCMMGRYSLDEEGLIYAGGEFDINKYKKFIPDNDGIIPIFEIEGIYKDDIVKKFVEFIETVYGKATLNENLKYIAHVLDDSKDMEYMKIIRNYFVKDFYNDHTSIYNHKPIYWLFDSGKKNGCKYLVYLHRYNKDTIANIKINYMPKIQIAYERILKDVEYKLNNDDSLSKKEKSDLDKEAKDIKAKIEECKDYFEAITHFADMKVELNLDDGVGVNYDKFIYEDKDKMKQLNLLAKSK